MLSRDLRLSSGFLYQDVEEGEYRWTAEARRDAIRRLSEEYGRPGRLCVKCTAERGTDTGTCGL